MNPEVYFRAVKLTVLVSKSDNVCVFTGTQIKNIFNQLIMYLMATSLNESYTTCMHTNSLVSRSMDSPPSIEGPKSNIMSEINLLEELKMLIKNPPKYSLACWSIDSPPSIDGPQTPQKLGSLLNTFVDGITHPSQVPGASPKNFILPIGLCGLIYPFFSNSANRRFIPYEELVKNARKAMVASRILCSTREHSMLFQAYLPCHWGSDASVQRGQKEVSPEALVTSIIDKPPSWNSKHHDKDLMRKFMSNSSSRALVINERKMKFEHVLPSRFSLLDCAVVRSELTDTWATSIDGRHRELLAEFQRLKSLKPSLLDEVVVKEVVVGLTSESDTEKIIKWAADQHDLDQRWCPMGVLSMDVEEVRIRTADYEKIIENSRVPKPKRIEITRWPTKGDSCTQFPVKIMLGNGYSWALMVSIPVIPGPGGKYEIGPVKFQDWLVEFLKKLPILVGVGVRLDVHEVVELVRQTTDENFSMKGWVDLSTLALLAGWNFPRYNMQAMSVQTLGAIMNKSVSRGDGEWGQLWQDIDDGLKVYCLGDLKFGHMTAVVLALLTLWDIFPDPDVVCSFTRKAPWEFAAKFFNWVFEALAGTEVDPRGLDLAKCRSELVDCIRTRSIQHKLSSHAPSRVAVFAKILGSWPSIRFGGPRYLHQVRTHFLSQCQVLADSMCKHWEDIMPYDCSNREMWEAATYAVVPLDESRWSTPDQSRGLALVVHPDLLSQTMVCPGSHISHSLIERLSKRYKRIKREMVLEWVRVNLSDLSSYFKRVENDPKLAQFPGSYYVEGRMIFRRCTGQPAPRMPSLDERRKHVAFNDGRDELERIRKAKQLKENIEKVIAVRELRYDHYAEVYADDDGHWSTLSWRGQLPGSKVELDDKYSRRDLRAVLFNEACNED